MVPYFQHDTNCILIACHTFKPYTYVRLQEAQKRPTKTGLANRAKKRKVNNVHIAKSTSVGTTKSARTNKSSKVDTDKSANVDTVKSGNVVTNNYANVGTNKSANAGTIKSANVDHNKSGSVGTVKSANVGTNKFAHVSTVESANVGISKSASIDTIKSANIVTKKTTSVGIIKSAKASKTTKRGKQQKSPVRQRKSGTVRKGKRAVSPRNAKKTTTKTKPKRASRSLRKERNKKGVNGKSVTASEEVSGEEHKHVNDYTDLSEDNSEDTAPLANTKSSPTQNGTVDENGEETDRDSIESIRCDEQLTHEETVSFVCSDSDTHDVDHDSTKHTAKSIGTGSHGIGYDSGSATEAGSDSSSESERSCTPLSNYISNESGRGCKITIKKTSNGFISGDQCGASSRQHGQSPYCSKKGKSRKSVVAESAANTIIVSGVTADCKTDCSTVDHNGISQIKSDMDTDAVSDNNIPGCRDSTVSDVASVCKTHETVVDDASCCKTDSSTEIYDVASRVKTDNDMDVHDVASRCEEDAPAVDDAMVDCETGASGVRVIAEPELNDAIEPETDTVSPKKMYLCTDVSAVSAECATLNSPDLIFSRHSNDTDTVSLPAEENDQSFGKPGRDNQGIDTADKSPSELLGPSDDDTEVRNNNVTSPAAHEEPIRLVYDRFILRCSFWTTL